MLSGDLNEAQLVWLDSRHPSPQKAVVSKISKLHGITAATLSPSMASFALIGADGRLSQCDAVLTRATGSEQSNNNNGTESSGTDTKDEAEPSRSIQSRLLSRFHASSITAMCPLPGQVRE